MEQRADDRKTVSLAAHKATSAHFERLYDSGMDLVEETAAYLDGDGRAEARSLGRQATSLYAAEWMRLTTRLMQIASWLLLQRALNRGEMNRLQVEAEREKIKLDTVAATTATPHWHELPLVFRDLVNRSVALQNEVQRMDAGLFNTDAETAVNDNPVNTQLNLLKTAFGG